nr:hypothetical protein GCM10020092_085710 [Actinoplanes digitatis]
MEIHVEAAPLERMHADVLQIEIEPGSRLAGVHIDELRLPVGAVVTLVVRDGAGFVPGPDTRLRTGDDLLIVTTAAARDVAERRLRAVSRRGLAGPLARRGRSREALIPLRRVSDAGFRYGSSRLVVTRYGAPCCR